MVVHPGPEEAGLGVGVAVAGRQRGQLLVHLLLRAPVGQVERAVRGAGAAGTSANRSSSELDADGGEHRRQVLVGDGGVAGHQPP